MSTYVVIKEYPDGHRLYRLLQATPRELERVRHDWTRIIPIPNIHSGITPFSIFHENRLETRRSACETYG